MAVEVGDWEEELQMADWGSCPIYDRSHGKAH